MCSIFSLPHWIVFFVVGNCFVRDDCFQSVEVDTICRRDFFHFVAKDKSFVFEDRVEFANQVIDIGNVGNCISSEQIAEYVSKSVLSCSGHSQDH